jgi:hypothetical protein
MIEIRGLENPSQAAHDQINNYLLIIQQIIVGLIARRQFSGVVFIVIVLIRRGRCLFPPTLFVASAILIFEPHIIDDGW